MTIAVLKWNQNSNVSYCLGRHFFCVKDSVIQIERLGVNEKNTENVIVQPCLNFNYIDQAYLCHDLWTYH